MDWANLIAVITLLVGGGGLLYYSQNKASKEIANVSALAAEWEKLYREQKAAREKRDIEVEDIRAEMVEFKAEVASIRPYICYDIACLSRIARNKQTKTTEK